MPAYNYGRFLREAVDSVLAQTDSDWELLILDDNSSDNTWEVLSTYSDPRIRTFRSDRNLGAGASLNALFEESSGELIAHLDADDRYDPEFVARQRAFLAEHPDVDICGTYVNEIGVDGGRTDAWQAAAWFNHTLDLNDPENWVWQNRLSHGSCMVRRQVFDNVGSLDPELRTVVDWDLWVRALAAGHRFAVIPEALFEWRIHGNNMTNADPAETVRAWSVISARTFHPYLDEIGRQDLTTQNIAGFLTHEVLTQQPLKYTTGILSTILNGDPDELAAAVTHVADESTRLRNAYVQLRADNAEAAHTIQQLTDELAATRLERDTLGDRLHAAETDRRAATTQLDKLRSTTVYKAARRMRNTLTRRTH
jgi:GT2 family glycosyltransferase/uncharacterized protein YqgV (UPF0045/DUF77 family)